jgi:hypothetical protein
MVERKDSDPNRRKNPPNSEQVQQDRERIISNGITNKLGPRKISVELRNAGHHLNSTEPAVRKELLRRGVTFRKGTPGPKKKHDEP